MFDEFRVRLERPKGMTTRREGTCDDSTQAMRLEFEQFGMVWKQFMASMLSANF